jgi:cytochrome c oxidase subunit 3
MSWFIFSEVMFFGAFFSALWWARVHSVPMLGNSENALLWEGFKAVWPSVAAGVTASPAGIIEPFQTMTPFWLPTINTALLLSSGVTLTISHHALIANQRAKTISFMWLTVALGLVFLFVQGYEYFHAYNDLNPKLTSGLYGSTFYMLTGFHGFHVFLGMLMLLFITLRLQKGHFTPDKHFGFEGAAWYWHFVDVVGSVHLGVLALNDTLADKGRLCGPFVSSLRQGSKECQSGGSSPFSKTAKC